jgi:hypothetical protein
MMILLKKLGEEKQLGVILSNIRYLEEYMEKHSRIHLNDSNQALYIEESLEGDMRHYESNCEEKQFEY